MDHATAGYRGQRTGSQNQTKTYSELEVLRTGRYDSNLLGSRGVVECFSAGASKGDTPNEHIVHHGSMTTSLG